MIKLKQVEHVRNERKTLAAVVGHPFITTLVASFSDEQSLYMLVRLSQISYRVLLVSPPWVLAGNMLTTSSWTFVQEARYSVISDVLEDSMSKLQSSMRLKSP